MPRIIDDDDERYKDVVDDNGLVRDGKIVRVSFMDSLRAHGYLMDDHPAGYMQDHRPGGPYVVDHRRAPGAAVLDDARQQLADAYADYDARDANAWKDPPNGPPLQRDANGEFGRDTPAGAYPLSAGEGCRCTLDGQDGRLVRKGNRMDAMPVEGARAEAYRLYDEEMANAWRKAR